MKVKTQMFWRFQANYTCTELAFSVKITDPKSFAMLILGNKFGGFTEHIIAPEEDRISINVIPSITYWHKWIYKYLSLTMSLPELISIRILSIQLK